MLRGCSPQHDGSTYEPNKLNRQMLIDCDLVRPITYGGARTWDRTKYPDEKVYPDGEARDNAYGPNNFWLSLAGIYHTDFEHNHAFIEKWFDRFPGRRTIYPLCFFPFYSVKREPVLQEASGGIAFQAGVVNKAWFATVVRDFVKRYAGRVWAYELWNEPGRMIRNGDGTINPAGLAELAETTSIAAKIIWECDPGALVVGSPLSNIRGGPPLIGGPAGEHAQYKAMFDAVDSAGVPLHKYLNGVSVHTYCYPEGTTHHPNEVGAKHLDYWTPRFRDGVLKPRGLDRLPLISSEYGIPYSYKPTDTNGNILKNADGTDQYTVLSDEECFNRTWDGLQYHYLNGFAAMLAFDWASGPYNTPLPYKPDVQVLGYDMSRHPGAARGWQAWGASHPR